MILKLQRQRLERAMELRLGDDEEQIRLTQSLVMYKKLPTMNVKNARALNARAPAGSDAI
ncbi:hypothetical protein T4C_10116 [Trichinella pseudospiralis]|uniref:Uncharacterized protein n=1 Tax=Trichinella pseudospiralis TaxID=6337 RepID=A0A0V1K5B9_TRIPS|nr:hypothetical protein T4C_10116 [Trichinella pseudospiralis]